MREIMFRGKDPETGTWYEGFYMALSDTTYCFKEDYDAHPDNTKHYIVFDRMTDWGIPNQHLRAYVDPSTVGQYTGLKDKNGKRIFEGDICRNTRTGEIVSVKWHGTMAGYVWNKRRADGFLFDFGELFRACDKYEVIGNIHDNPEMLKGGDSPENRTD